MTQSKINQSTMNRHNKKRLNLMHKTRHLIAPESGPTSRAGFTLVEMLVAMTVTLLMMAALARAFAYVGTQIQESRADTQLATSLRDVTTKLQDDLGQCTVELKPNTGLEEDQNGYFLYYEGPVTDATSSLLTSTCTSPSDTSDPFLLSIGRHMRALCVHTCAYNCV